MLPWLLELGPKMEKGWAVVLDLMLEEEWALGLVLELGVVLKAVLVPVWVLELSWKMHLQLE